MAQLILNFSPAMLTSRTLLESLNLDYVVHNVQQKFLPRNFLIKPVIPAKKMSYSSSSHKILKESININLLAGNNRHGTRERGTGNRRKFQIYILDQVDERVS